MPVSEYTKDEALAFIDAMRLTLVNRVGFKWMVDRLASLAAYIESTCAENERLNAFIDSSNARDDYEAFCAARCARTDLDAESDRAGNSGSE
jgi:hypothetical protein